MATQLRELEVDLITRGHLERGIDALGDEFAGTFSPETIERYMVESLQALPAARFKQFVPLLVHRFARERLQALAQVEGKVAKDVPEVRSDSSTISVSTASAIIATCSRPGNLPVGALALSLSRPRRRPMNRPDASFKHRV